MPYPALPDRRMPYDNDGTLVYFGTLAGGAVRAASGAQTIELQDSDYTEVDNGNVPNGTQHVTWLFFPEQREVTGIYYIRGTPEAVLLAALHGSNDTANGLDGTWETASLPGGVPGRNNDFAWRSDIKPVSFTGPKQNIRAISATVGAGGSGGPRILHVYGEAAAGAMAHDLVFINHDDTPGQPFQAPEDFGDQPLGTTVVRQFRLKNTSATKTATGINIQCNDADFVIAEAAGGPWVVTINLASLGPGAESPTYYVRCTTPAPGAALQPRYARIVLVCDSGFFG